MKTKEELNALKEEFEALNAKLAELSNDELAQITGGTNDDGGHEYAPDLRDLCSYMYDRGACPFPENKRGHFRNCKDCPKYQS